MSRSGSSIVVGERYPGTRWTVLRHAAPGPRRGRSRARVVARCSCGAEQALFVEDLAGGRSSGCRSTACLARWEAVGQLRGQIEALLEAFLRG